ncbi:MAG: sulfatase-like hydrolase/transferase [Planctomycetota bacterium]
MKQVLQLWLFALLCTTARAERPNVILMMADDLGYNDVSCYGSERNRTPFLDQMADEGVRLTSFYAGASVCSPSRMALLSGSYPARLGWERGVLGYLMEPRTGMSLDVVTIAESFRDAGYRTAMAGKWHVGAQTLDPMHQGFDESYFILASNNMSRDMFRGQRRIHEDYDNRLLSQAFTEEVVRLINVDSDQPFLIYVPFTAPHFPASAHPDWRGRSNNSAYGDVVEELDARVGEILAALKQRGIDDQTLVVFISDNGPEPNQRRFNSAAPFSGRKWNAREGGLRVPGIIRWPGSLEAGRVSDAMVSAMDLYPTLAHVCGVPINIPESGQKLDGLNVWGSITGEDPAQARDELLYWHGKGKASAIRSGEFKLFFDAGEGDPNVRNGPVLYNLAEDPGETTDLSDKHPDIVAELLERARQQLADIEQHALPIGRWSQQ